MTPKFPRFLKISHFSFQSRLARLFFCCVWYLVFAVGFFVAFGVMFEEAVSVVGAFSMLF